MIDLTADGDTSDSEEESYQCKICGKSYSEINELLTHTLAHSAQLTEDKTNSEAATETIGKPADGKTSVAVNKCDEVVDLTDDGVSSSQIQTECDVTGDQTGRGITEAFNSFFPRKGQRGVNLPKQTDTEAFTITVPTPSPVHTAEGPKQGLTHVLDLTKEFPISFYGVSNLSEKRSVQTLSYSDPQAGPTRENPPTQEKPPSSFDVDDSKRVDTCTPTAQVPCETYTVCSDPLSEKNSSQTSGYSNQQTDLGGPAEEVVQASFDGNDRIDACTPTLQDPCETYTKCSDPVPFDNGSGMIDEDEDTCSGALIIDDIDSCNNVVTNHSNVDNPSGVLPHKCKECNKSFASLRQLLYHSRVHCGLKCSVCMKVCKSVGGLITHLEIHKECRPYCCNLCGGQFKTRPSLKRHMLVHSDGRLYECKICGDRFKRVQTLKKHQKVHRPYVCVICGVSFKTESILALHNQSHIVETIYHSQNTRDSDISPLMSDSNSLQEHGDASPELSVGVTAPIDFRDSTTSSNSSESTNRNVKEEPHREPKETTLESNLPVQFKVDSIEASKDLHAEGDGEHKHESSHSRTLPYKCASCEMSFFEFHQLSVHSQLHEVDNPTSCDICGMVFAVLKSLKKHLDMHTKGQTLDCVVCGKKGFKSKYKLRKHMIVHSVARPYKCKICAEAFKSSDNLKAHVTVHSDDRPHKCVICRKGFKTSSGNALHIRTHLVEGRKNARKLLKAKVDKYQNPNDYLIEEVDQNTSTCSNTSSIKSESMDRNVKEEVQKCNDVDRIASGKGETSITHTNMLAHRKSNETDIDIRDWINLPSQIEFDSVLDTELTTGETASNNVHFHGESPKVSGQSRTLPYKCGSCEKSFLKFHQLSFHSRIHKDESPINCEVCGMVFAVRESLKKHLDMHTKGRTLDCVVCGKKGFKTKTKLAQHMVVHSDVRPYKCKICGQTFKRSADLRTHVTLHSDDRPYKCVICRKAFRTTSARACHVRSHIIERRQNTGNSLRPADDKSQKSGEQHDELTQNTTSGHPSTFIKSSDTSGSMDIDVKEQQQECSDVDRIVSGKSDTDMATDETTSGNVHLQEDGISVPSHTRTLPYKCRSCEMSFLKFYQLSIHSRIHSFDNPVKCDVCGLVVEESLQKHLEAHCKRQLPTCGVCGKVFGTKFQLKQHMAVHSDARPYKCKTCGKDFKRPIDLKAHVAIHSNDRPYKCVICRRGFKTHSQRSSHLHSHTVKNSYH